MENREQETANPTAAGISADFLTGSTEVGLDRIRTRLLDLTNRNKLLNFRHSPASSLRVVDVSIDAVFRQLRDTERLAFLAVPEPEIADGDPPPAKAYAEELGWHASFDLVNDDDDGAQGLPVLLYHEQLDALSRKIASAAKTAVEESGANMLYLVFGFLEWYESDDSKQPHLAPLVVLPVTIERTGGKGRAVETIIEYSGEDVATNLSLVEKMRRDFGLEIPALEDDDTPEIYFGRFADILKLKKSWCIRRHITLALLSFGKLLMYRDLDPKTWPAGQSIASHPLVRELFEGSKNPAITLAEEYPIDAPELVKDVPHLIRDADSSQHSALVHALRGKNLVIEGPPGTGKSQTITNLIAAALARGKTVLFVAEKLAAIEVVRRRLDSAGLGLFCLEVHSHKTKKGAMLADLAQRCTVRGTFKEPRELDRYLSVVEEKKRLLTQYASLINKVIEPYAATVFEILWARDRCGQDISRHLDVLGRILLPAVVQFSRLQFTQAEHFLSVYGRHLSVVLAACDSIDRHPWAWVANPLPFEEEERILGLLQQFLELVRTADGHCERLQEVAGIVLTRTPRGLDNASSMLTLLPRAGAAIIEELLTPCRSAETRERLRGFCEHVESFRSAFRKVSASTSNASPLLDTRIADELSEALKCLHQCGLDGYSVAETRTLLNLASETAEAVRQAQSSFAMLLSLFGCEAPATLSSATFLLETARMVETAPFDHLHFRLAAFEDERTRPVLKTAQMEAAALRESEIVLGRDFDLTTLSGPDSSSQLLQHASVLDEASLWRRIFGRDYRSAVMAYRRTDRQGRKVSRRKMSVALRTLANYLQERWRFDNHAAYRETFGVHFRGVSTTWGDLEAIVMWYEQVFAALPEHHTSSEPFRKLLFTARAERLKAIKASLNTMDAYHGALHEVTSRIAEFTHAVPSQRALMVSGSFDEILAGIEKLTREVSNAMQTVERAAIGDSVLLRDVKYILVAAGRCRSAMFAVQRDADLPELVGARYRGIDTEIEPIEHTVQFAESIASGRLLRKTSDWLLCTDYGQRLADLRDWLGGAKDSAAVFHDVCEQLGALSGSTIWTGNADRPWGSLQAVAECALHNREGLSSWNHFLRVRIQSRDGGLDKLTNLAETRGLEPQELVPAFHFAFYNTLARSVFTDHAELSQVTGLTQEELRRQFAAADRESIRLYSERVAAIIDQRPLPSGNQAGPVRTWTDMALVTNEINKQKRHIPIRQADAAFG
jgi:hypothetical protein